MSVQSYGVADANLKSVDALPAAASTTVNGTGIDVGTITGISSHLERAEFLLSAPALSTTILPDTKTMTCSIQGSALANFSSSTTLAGSILTQTGASGAGAAASSCRFKIPSTGPRYIRAVAVSGVNTTNAAALSMTFQLLF